MLFEKLIGNSNAKDILIKAINLNNILHSYMFIGPEGVGKKQFAKQFAKMVLCMKTDKEENGPCNECKSCIEFESNNNPDFYILEEEQTNIKIEQIRMLQSKIYEKPIISDKKVYIIDNSEKMTKEAQNSLLKTLEEPPEYIIIILISSNENILLNTIKSRCMKIPFNKIEDDVLEKYLEEEHKYKIDKSKISIYEGSIKKALILKEKEELYNNVETFFKMLEKDNIIDILNNSEVIYKNKENIYDILEYINILLFNKTKEDKKSSYNLIKYTKCIDIVEKTKKKLKANSNFDMCIDSMLFNMRKEFES